MAAESVSNAEPEFRVGWVPSRVPEIMFGVPHGEASSIVRSDQADVRGAVGEGGIVLSADTITEIVLAAQVGERERFTDLALMVGIDRAKLDEVWTGVRRRKRLVP